MRAESTPTFSHDIAPIVYSQCAVCHHERGPAPFPLTSYQDVKRHAQQIVVVTRSRYMPPWPPQQGHGEFQDERRLSDSQIHLIADWVRAGEPEGPASEMPAEPQYAGDWQLGPPDLILIASKPLLLPASGPDVFWNFIFAPGLKKPRYVRAVEIKPGNDQSGTRAVHHANIVVDRTGATLRLEKSRGAGFAGMELALDRNPFDPDSHFLFWKPGSLPYSEPDGFAWGLGPGNLLVLNTHLQPTGKAEQIQPSIGLYFTDRQPLHFPLLVQLEHDGALNIPAGVRDFPVSDDFQMPIDADVLAIYPHAHYLGKLLEAFATLPDGTRKELIRIPDWDLNWQAVYRYKEPVFLPKGSVVHMRYHFDNSIDNARNPNHPPQRVEAGNRARDEMGHLWLQILPRGSGARRRVVQEALMRHRLEKYPNDFQAHLNLGALLLSRLDSQGAAAMLQAAVRIDPSRPEAHEMLGSALRNLGELSRAIAEYRTALRVSPDYVNARFDLAEALVKQGNFQEAAEQFRPVALAYPESARLQNEYGELLAKNGKYTEALSQFDKATALEPASEVFRQNREFVMKKMRTMAADGSSR